MISVRAYHRRTSRVAPNFILIQRLMYKALIAAVLVLAPSTGAAGQTARQNAAERQTEAHLNAIRTRPDELQRFLRQMPKGADLHNHISGAVYAESYIKWAAAASSPRLCVDLRSLSLSQETPDNLCSDAARPAAAKALTDSGLYNHMIDAWSMRNWESSGETGHDHFFRAFAKFNAAIEGHFGDMLADVASRAADGNVSYLELMLTPDNGVSSSMGQGLKWSGDLAAMRNELLEKGISKAVQAGQATLDKTEARERKALGCGTAKPQAGCKVAIKFIFQVGRTSPPSVAFAQMVAAMEMAGADPRLVALNLVAPEDSDASMSNFALQMQMLNYLHSVYPKAHITLHAGELAPAFVEAHEPQTHIRDSIEQAHAERIGHGVDVMQEQDAAGLLKEMADRKTLVEICLSSNDLILGVRGKDHPLNTYIKDGVPVALATDDEGVARSDITTEYVRAVEDQGLGYWQLKTMARTSLEYSFASGSSLWKNREGFVPVAECAADVSGIGTGRTNHTANRGRHDVLSESCRSYLDSNEKATLQWNLEKQFRQFEKSIASKTRRPAARHRRAA
jgi:adenosine deaminase